MAERDRAPGRGRFESAGPQPVQRRAIAPGKTTNVLQREAAPEPELNPDVRPPAPPEYASLDTDLVDKLWAARHRFETFKDKTAKGFWPAIRTIPVNDLHTLVQVTAGAKSLGLWQFVHEITDWYTNNASWGILFKGADPTAFLAGGGKWGKDSPQRVVQHFHHDTTHTWYRNDSGAGKPGMHIGVDNGGSHDLHWDATNPMHHVGHGDEGEGTAMYDPRYLLSHGKEVGAFGKQERVGETTPTEKFSAITRAANDARLAKELAQVEAGNPYARDKERSAMFSQTIHSAAQRLLDIEVAARPLALENDAATKARLDAFEVTRLKREMDTACAAYFRFLREESGNMPDFPEWDRAEHWSENVYGYATPAVHQLRERRRFRSEG